MVKEMVRRVASQESERERKEMKRGDTSDKDEGRETRSKQAEGGKEGSKAGRPAGDSGSVSMDEGQIIRRLSALLQPWLPRTKESVRLFLQSIGGLGLPSVDPDLPSVFADIAATVTAWLTNNGC